MTQTIHPATTQDHPRITELWEASVRATHHFLEEEYILYIRPLLLSTYLNMVSLYCTRNFQNRITGFLGVSGARIEMLFIDPAFSGQGIGKQLLNFAVQELKTNEVDVNEQNGQALGFYEHMGFKTISRSETDSLGKPYPILHMKL